MTVQHVLAIVFIIFMCIMAIHTANNARVKLYAGTFKAASKFQICVGSVLLIALIFKMIMIAVISTEIDINDNKWSEWRATQKYFNLMYVIMVTDQIISNLSIWTIIPFVYYIFGHESETKIGYSKPKLSIIPVIGCTERIVNIIFVTIIRFITRQILLFVYGTLAFLTWCVLIISMVFYKLYYLYKESYNNNEKVIRWNSVKMWWSKFLIVFIMFITLKLFDLAVCSGVAVILMVYYNFVCYYGRNYVLSWCQ